MSRVSSHESAFSLREVVQNSVLNSRVPAKVLAEAVQKPYPTLMRELNPYDPNAKLGIETLLAIIKVTEDVEPLAFMARQLGYDLVKTH